MDEFIGALYHLLPSQPVHSRNLQYVDATPQFEQKTRRFECHCSVLQLRSDVLYVSQVEGRGSTNHHVGGRYGTAPSANREVPWLNNACEASEIKTISLATTKAAASQSFWYQRRLSRFFFIARFARSPVDFVAVALRQLHAVHDGTFQVSIQFAANLAAYHSARLDHAVDADISKNIDYLERGEFPAFEQLPEREARGAMLITAERSERNCAISLALIQKPPFASFLVPAALARRPFIARRDCSPA